MDLCPEESLPRLAFYSFSVIWESFEVYEIEGRLNKLSGNKIRKSLENFYTFDMSAFLP